jgi:Phosphotransferase system, mannose/fructose/N-acetylgalactosamine-specific component IIC
MLFAAIVAGIWATIQAWRPGYGTHVLWMQPLLTGFIFGLVFGDMPTGMILGSAIGLMYVGLIAPGSELPADMALAGSIGIPIAMAIGADPNTAIMIALPFGVLGVFINELRRIINGKLAHSADKHALSCNEKGIRNCAIVYPLIINFFLRFPPVFLAVYFGADFVKSLMAMLPGWVMHGISVAGGMLPAIGFALIIILIGRASIIPFFFIGFFLVKYSSISVVAAACFGIPLAISIVLMTKEAQDEVRKEFKMLTAQNADDDEE